MNAIDIYIYPSGSTSNHSDCIDVMMLLNNVILFQSVAICTAYASTAIARSF